MSRKQKEQIIDYFFNQPKIPEDIRRTFEKWMLSLSGEPETEQKLEEMWNSHTSYSPEEETEKGLQKLHTAIRWKNVMTIRRRALQTAGIAAAVILFFAGGYFTARQSHVETVTLLTSKESVGEFTLPDGTTVWLNGETQLQYPETFSKRSREVHLSGEAFFEVEKDSLRPFRVNMKSMQVEVLGTSFDAISYDFGTVEELILKTGSVQVFAEGFSGPVTLLPNEKLTLDKRDHKYSVETVDARNYCQWFTPHLTFDNTPLRDIITNLERRFSINITVSPGVRLDTRISLVIDREPLADIMEVIESLVPIRYEIGERTLSITGR